MSKILAVDGNFYLYRIFFTQRPHPELGTEMARRFLALVCKDAHAVSARRLIVAFDGPKNFRRALDDGYKTNRARIGPSPYDHLQIIIQYLLDAGINTVQYREYEADDVLCSVAMQNQEVVAACKDKDAYQYVRPGITLYDSTHKVDKKPAPLSTDCAGVLARFGVKPSQCVDYQCIVGDKIDTIPNIVKPSVAKRGLAQYGTLKNWIAEDREFRIVLKPNRERMILNRRLVRLCGDLDVDIKPTQWKTGSFPKTYLDYRDWCNAKTLF